MDKKTSELANVAKIFEQKKNKSILLSIDLNGVLNFYLEDVIEFDINPKEIVGLTEANLVFDFMRKLSKTMDKEIILTGENSPEEPFVTVKSDGTLLIHI